MKKIIDKEHDCNQVTNGDMVERPAEKFTHAEVINVIKAMKTAKIAGTSEVNLK